jgi:hypothetical protein
VDLYGLAIPGGNGGSLGERIGRGRGVGCTPAVSVNSQRHEGKRRRDLWRAAAKQISNRTSTALYNSSDLKLDDCPHQLAAQTQQT